MLRNIEALAYEGKEFIVQLQLEGWNKDRNGGKWRCGHLQAIVTELRIILLLAYLGPQFSILKMA